MLRRVEDQRRVNNGEAECREDLNEEQRVRSLRDRGEKAFQRFHRALISPATPGDVKPAHDARSEEPSPRSFCFSLSHCYFLRADVRSDEVESLATKFPPGFS